jgi:hypothetical protein
MIWNGDPHPTGSDPIHVSGIIGRKSLKGKNRVTSFHAYPNGVVKFSDKSLPIVQVDTTGNTALGTTAGTTSGSGVSEAQTEYWTWSLDHGIGVLTGRTFARPGERFVFLPGLLLEPSNRDES